MRGWSRSLLFRSRLRHGNGLLRGRGFHRWRLRPGLGPGLWRFGFRLWLGFRGLRLRRLFNRWGFPGTGQLYLFRRWRRDDHSLNGRQHQLFPLLRRCPYNGAQSSAMHCNHQQQPKRGTPGITHRRPPQAASSCPEPVGMRQHAACCLPKPHFIQLSKAELTPKQALARGQTTCRQTLATAMTRPAQRRRY